jgi:hypothetical protein
LLSQSRNDSPNSPIGPKSHLWDSREELLLSQSRNTYHNSRIGPKSHLCTHFCMRLAYDQWELLLMLFTFYENKVLRITISDMERFSARKGRGSIHCARWDGVMLRKKVTHTRVPNHPRLPSHHMLYSTPTEKNNRS